MKSIRTVLTLSLLVPLTIVAMLVAVETFYSARKVSNDLNDRTLLAASLTILEHVISSNGSLLADATLNSLTETLGDQFFYHVRGPNGAFVTGYSQYPQPPTQESSKLATSVFYDGVHQGIAVRSVQMQRDLTDREFNGITTITTWQRISQRRELTLNLFARSVVRLLLLSAIAGVIVWFAVKVGLRPLARLQTSIDNRSDFALSPIMQTVPAELSGIVQSMNTLFARVARSKKNRERFIGDAAHQLRNPIAAIKVQAQSALESDSPPEMSAGLKQILAVSDKSTTMINKMLSGAKVHAMDGSDSEFSEFDLCELIKEHAREMVPLAFDKSQDFSMHGTDESCLIFGNKTLLGEAISNLVHNAIEHNAIGTKISVALVQGTDDKYYDIAVSDEGEKISDNQFQQLTQPFLTADDEKGGSGLGLSIAKDITRLHRGELFNRATDTGKEIILRLPKDKAKRSVVAEHG